MDKRIKDRKNIGILDFCDLTSLENYNVIAHCGCVVDASVGGVLLQIERCDLVSEDLKRNLNIDEIVGQNVALYLPDMSLDLDGFIVRADHIGKGQYQIAIEFSQDIPEYWRECLLDLLPSSDEFGEVI